MPNKQPSDRVIFRTKGADASGIVYRVTSKGEKARVWSCTYSSVWKLLKEMPLHEFEAWAVRHRLKGAESNPHELLKGLVVGKAETVYNK